MSTKDIKIMTWNILADIWLNEKEYYDIPLKYLDKNYRYHKNKEIINLVDADIILLQEVQNDIYSRLNKDYGNKYYLFFYTHELKHWSDELAPNKKLMLNGNVTMVKKTFSITDHFQSAKLKLSSTGDVAGLLKIKDFLIVNIHLELEESIRIHESKNLVEFINEFISPETSIIIGGDFNSDIGDIVHNIYTSGESYQNLDLDSALAPNRSISTRGRNLDLNQRFKSIESGSRAGFLNLVINDLYKHSKENPGSALAPNRSVLPIRQNLNLSTYYCQGKMDDHIYISGLKNIDGYIFDELIDTSLPGLESGRVEINKKICETHLLQTYGSDHFPVIGLVKRFKN